MVITISGPEITLDLVRRVVKVLDENERAAFGPDFGRALGHAVEAWAAKVDNVRKTIEEERYAILRAEETITATKDALKKHEKDLRAKSHDAWAHGERRSELVAKLDKAQERLKHLRESVKALEAQLVAEKDGPTY